MAATDAFSLEEGPYIPADHAGCDLLPRCRRDGGEVFSYPAELDVIDELLSKHEQGEDAEQRVSLLIPYGERSYSCYFEKLSAYIEKYRKLDPELSELIEWLAAAVRRANVKEDWSVVRYTGDQYDEDESAQGSGLTKGRCYYWPCSKEHPVYEGVIDDEEFTSYLYPCDPDSWEIVSDPTGMASRALAGEAETVSSWKVELESDPNSIEAWAKEVGASAKRIGGQAAFEDDLDEGWSASETDPVEVPCPGCGRKFLHGAHTLVNARKNPELRDLLIAGRLFEFTCPECGYTASLASPCLYLDPAHRSSIYLVVDEAMGDGVAGMFDDLSSDDTPVGRSVKRIVFDRHELREKVVALEAGLDDRVIEILKMAITGSAKMQGNVDPDADCSVKLIELEGGGLVFSIDDGEASFTAVMPRGGYDLYRDALERSSLSEEQPYLVDRKWAEFAIDVLDEEGAFGS